MPQCTGCGTELAAEVRFCSSCGRQNTPPSQMMTAADVGRAAAAAVARAPSPANFAPGTLVAERYRIVALLGRGGMGEVYRVDDLKLGHAVALKFLPPEYQHDARLLERLFGEVRNARQVSHPNVCRVYDIGEVSGRHFLTMEYIDGEDLASLLRRIGRLPPDKALEIAHQLCAGLAAAHDAGLLHRDLKPANIMLDGRGRARITDFGLAVATGDHAERRQFAGTPAYMAPEQKAGAPATVQTDLYSLGLVLFEIFTGKRAFEEGALERWKAEGFRTSGSPLSPAAAAFATRRAESGSSVSAEVDPAVQRAILRCLERDPALRPSSALLVSAALPGGDPLAAAIAAGETPSPELVAQGGQEVAISTRAAALLLLAVVVLLAISVPLARRATVLGLAPAIKSPDALTERAQEIARRAGYSEQPADSYVFFQQQTQFMAYQAEHVASPARYHDFNSVFPNPHRFFYMQSPQPLVTQNPFNSPSPSDPPPQPGVVLVAVDGVGRLVRLIAVPPEVDKDVPAAGAAQQPDWPALFADAGVNIKDFTPAAPRIIPSTAFDIRAAWDGQVGGVPFHVDAASFRGRPVDFFVRGPWNPERSPKDKMPVGIVVISVVLGFIIPGAGLLLAIRNLRLGRADVRGATRLACVVAITILISTLLTQHWAADPNIVMNVFWRTAATFFVAGIAWVSYAAVEPLLRRQLPHLLVSWTRLLAGRFSDPMVGRDLLIGVSAGIAVNAFRLLGRALPWWFNVPGVVPHMATGILQQPVAFAATIVSNVPGVLLMPLLLAVQLVVLRVFTKRQWLVAGLLFLISWLASFGGLDAAVEVPVEAVVTAVWLFVFFRYGLLAFAAIGIPQGLLFYAPPDLRVNSWYFARPLIALALVLAAAVYGFYCATRGRRLFTTLLDEG